MVRIMKNIKFYLEYNTPKDKKENHNNGNVIAYFPRTNHCLYGKLSGAVSGRAITIGYLHKWCKRIDEDIARIIHPKLFEVL